MQDLIEIFHFGFMQRALIGGVLVAFLTSWMGILVVLRQASFFGDAIAHSSLTGVAIGLLFGFNPILAASVYAVIISFILPSLKKKSNLPIDSLLGFILPFSMAIGVILLALIPGYQPELISFLFGSILSISWGDIYIVLGLILLSFLVILVLRKKLIMASFDEEYAKVSGIKVGMINIIYDVLMAITIVAGIKFVGIVLVNALLVIPASTSRLFVRSLRQMFVVTPIIAVVSVVVGLLGSYVWDLPSGPMVAVASGIFFLMGVVVKQVVD